MSRENITVQLLGCGGIAEIRSFIKNRDRKAVQRAMLASKEYKQSDLKASEGGSIELTIAGSDLVDITGEQTRCLLVSFNGIVDNPYEAMLDSECEEDMLAVETAASEVFNKASVEKQAKK